MDIRRDILSKYMEQAAIEQLASDYQKLGYEIKKPTSDLAADLVVQKGKEVIVFEVKAGQWDSQKRQNVKALRNKAVHDLRAKFNLVFVKLPEEPTIEIEGLEELLFELMPEHFIDEFSRLATHFQVDEVSDITLDSIEVNKESIDVAGTGIVSIGLQYGSDGDYARGDGVRFTESYPFNFHLSLDHMLELKEVLELQLDSPQDDE